MPDAVLTPDVRDLWVYLSASPLFHLTLTLAAFVVAQALSRRFGGSPLLNPVLLTVVMVVSILLITGTDYRTYFQGAQFVHFLLGPVTVALAIPLYRQRKTLLRYAIPLVASLLIGSATAVVSAVMTVRLLDGRADTVSSMAPKSITAAVAMGVSEQIGGLPSLTAVLVMMTGIFGAVAAPSLLRWFGITDQAAVGLAIGTASHGIGTARALQIGETCGAFSGLAMGLNAVATALLLPVLWPLLLALS